jgi:hypothetical protein
MSKFIPVDPDKWAEMVKALSEVTRLKAENERLTKAHSDALADFWGIHKGYFDLKAEVEAQAKRWAESEDLISHYKEQRDEAINDCQCARLKAEVEELKSQPDPLTAYLYADTLRRDDIKTLKAHIDRLTKAGNAMASIIKYEPGVNTFDPIPDVVKRWNAAKEGKQP